MHDALLTRLRQALRRHSLLVTDPSGPGDLTAAVSGGLDSVVLLHALVALGQRPTVACVDHGLRPESAAESLAVARLAEALGLPFVGLRVELRPGPDLARRAREARLTALLALPQPRVALAHHLDDQAETVLDRLARGSGARGLSAMAPRRDRLIRPLLFARRAELRAWAEARGLRWAEDPSNARGTRGALRHEVLPALERLREGAAAGLARSARLLAEDDAALEALAAGLRREDGLDLVAWREAPAPLRRRALSALVEDCRGPGHRPSAAQIDAALALDGPGRGVPLSGGWRVVVDTERLRALPPPPGPARIAHGAWGLWRVEAAQAVCVRPPAAGERLHGRSLAEALRAAGVPASLRPYHPVFERGGRRWVPGLPPAPAHPGHATSPLTCLRQSSPSVPGGGPYSIEL